MSMLAYGWFQPRMAQMCCCCPRQPTIWRFVWGSLSCSKAETDADICNGLLGRMTNRAMIEVKTSPIADH